MLLQNHKYLIFLTDVEKPTIGQCDGPVTNNGIIETPDQFATVFWPVYIYYKLLCCIFSLSGGLIYSQSKVKWTIYKFKVQKSSVMLSFRENMQPLHSKFLKVAQPFEFVFLIWTITNNVVIDQVGHLSMHDMLH